MMIIILFCTMYVYMMVIWLNMAAAREAVCVTRTRTQRTSNWQDNNNKKKKKESGCERVSVNDNGH